MEFIKNRLPFREDLRSAYRSFRKHGDLGRFLHHRVWSTRRFWHQAEPAGPPINTDSYTAHFTCCHQHVSLLFWALHSWYATTGQSPRIYVHDDGSLTGHDCRVLEQAFPRITVLRFHESTRKAEETWLPQLEVARSYRLHSGLFFPVKLLDPFFVSEADHVLILDTDILWFQRPEELLTHLQSYQAPLFWAGPRPFPFRLRDGASLPRPLEYLNTGLVYYRKSELSLAVVEDFLRRVDPHSGYQPALDQPAYIWTLSQGREVQSLPLDKYIIKGPARKNTIGKHYTGPRRERFWSEGVHRLLKSVIASPES